MTAITKGLFIKRPWIDLTRFPHIYGIVNSTAWQEES